MTGERGEHSCAWEEKQPETKSKTWKEQKKLSNEFVTNSNGTCYYYYYHHFVEWSSIQIHYSSCVALRWFFVLTFFLNELFLSSPCASENVYRCQWIFKPCVYACWQTLPHFKWFVVLFSFTLDLFHSFLAPFKLYWWCVCVINTFSVSNERNKDLMSSIFFFLAHINFRWLRSFLWTHSQSEKYNSKEKK